jgi:uncharacterized protein YxeA
MKNRRDIFLKFFLLIVLFLFHGINAYSNLDPQRYYIQISHDTDKAENRLTPDNDTSDEDQIDQYNNSDLSDQHGSQIISVSTLPLLNILFVSVWQPPKIF